MHGHANVQYDTIIFDGLHISLCNLRKQIMEREKLKAANSHLQIFNADTGEEYSDDNAPIPKNSSVTVRRIPGVGAKSRGKTYSARRTEPVMGTAEANGDASAPLSLAQLARTANLAEANASEEDKIKAMMSQCGRVYAPTNSTKKPLGPPPPSYICFRCGMPGHHIKSCPTIQDEKFDSGPRIRRCTGIPTSFLMEVKDPHTKGAMLTNTGKLVIPIIDAEAYAIGKKEKPPFLPEEPSSSSPSEEGDPVPEELLCPICEDIMVDAAIIPCCGNSYCDECIRTALLESDEHTCPTCHQDDVSPDALAANQVLRRAVNNFENGTGYTKGPGKQFPPPPRLPPPLPIPPPRGQTQKTPQPLMKSPVWRHQDPLMIPVTSSSAHPTPSVASLTSDPSPSAARVPGNASSAPAPVPDATATGSILVHSEKSDGPLRDPDDKLLPTAAIGSEQSKGAASTETTALGEEKGSQMVVDQVGDIPRSSGTWFRQHGKSEEGKDVTTEVWSAGHSTAIDRTDPRHHHPQQLQCIRLLSRSFLLFRVYVPHSSLLGFLLTSPDLQDIVSLVQVFHQLPPAYGSLVREDPTPVGDEPMDSESGTFQSVSEKDRRRRDKPKGTGDKTKWKSDLSTTAQKENALKPSEGPQEKVHGE
ncbi:hypothetical protein STEG23_025627 [Scotinomys teguina]